MNSGTYWVAEFLLYGTPHGQWQGFSNTYDTEEEAVGRAKRLYEGFTRYKAARVRKITAETVITFGTPRDGQAR
jgi:hypothetical protein